VTGRRPRLLLLVSAFSLAFAVQPRAALADMGNPFGPGFLSGPSARWAVFVVLASAVALSALGVMALWRISLGSAMLEDTEAARRESGEVRDG
jgi:hypothetical protein